MSSTDDVLTDLALSRGTLDRAGNERRDDPDLLARLLADSATCVAELRGDRLRTLRDDAGEVRLVMRPPSDADRARLGLDLGRDADGTAYVAVIDDGPAAEPGWLGLRQAGSSLGARDAGIFTTALALANWHATHTHCPRCGARTEPVSAGWIRRCTSDGSDHYPRTDPAVIMSVLDQDDRLLLGRSPQWPEGRFSVLAGFVEPGESFEAAVAREVREEVGVVVEQVRYLGNQPWPFPASIMIGYTATARQTALTLDAVEMAEAHWVTREQYRAQLRSGQVRTPSGISIAKRLIERWLGHRVEAVNGREA